MKKFLSSQYGRQKLDFFPAPYRAPLRAFAVFIYPWVNENIVLCDIESRGWCIPGGRVEPYETSSQAAHREALEEAGAILDRIQYIGCFKMTDNTLRKSQVRWADAYTAKVKNLVPINPNFESKGRKLLTLEEIPNIYYQWNQLSQEVFKYSKEVLARMNNIYIT